jgi:2,3-bisphosphoglycerate-dependent phosphoglycerate mutase
MQYNETNTQQNADMQTSTGNTFPVVMIRHAQSLWNKENRFTGWADPPLTEAGVQEAKLAGDILKILGYQFDMAYSSCLHRASHTLDILLERIGQAHLTRTQDWRLNERHYGALQGKDKAEMIARMGEQQVWRWRRGYEDRADPLSKTDARHPIHDGRYVAIDPQVLPDVENLAETRLRIMAFWQEQVQPRMLRGKRILLSAHGNSLRALLMGLGDMSVAEVEAFEIPTATPIVYEFDQKGRPLQWNYLDVGVESARLA